MLCCLSKVTQRSWICNSESLSFSFFISNFSLSAEVTCYFWFFLIIVFFSFNFLKDHLQNSFPMRLESPPSCTLLFLLLLIHTHSGKIPLPARNIPGHPHQSLGCIHQVNTWRFRTLVCLMVLTIDSKKDFEESEVQ